jgi:hypothetical protein
MCEPARFSARFPWTTRQRLGRSRPDRERPTRLRPHLEPLEDRLVPSTYTYQQGVNGYSSTVAAAISSLGGGSPNGTTWRDATADWCMGVLPSQGYSESPLIRFQNLGIPAGSTVSSATLTLHLVSWVSGQRVIGHYLNVPWDNGPDPLADTTDPNSLGWVNRAANTPWAAPGATGDGTDVLAGKSFALPQQGTFSAVGDTYATATLDPAVVQNWINNPSSNYGIVLTVDLPDHHMGLVQPQRDTSARPVTDRPLLPITVGQGAPPPIPQQLFAVGLDGQVYTQTFDATGSSAGAYTPTGPGAVQTVVVGHDASGRSETFVLGLDGQVYLQKFDTYGSPNGGYSLAAPGQVQTLAVGYDAANDPELFVLGLDDQVWAAKLDATGSPTTGYFLAAPGQVRAFVVGSDASSRPELFALGLDGQVWAAKLDSTGSPATGYFLADPGQVTKLVVGHDAQGHPELFVLGLDSQVWAAKFDATGSPLGGYFLVDAGQVKTFDVSNDASGNPELFVLGLDNQVWAAKLDGTGSPVAGYFLAAVGQVQAFVVSHDASKDPELFAQGLDGQVWVAKFDATGSPVGGYGLTQAGQVKESHATR